VLKNKKDGGLASFRPISIFSESSMSFWVVSFEKLNYTIINIFFFFFWGRQRIIKRIICFRYLRKKLKWLWSLYYVCMYVLHLYPALSQKRSNDGRVCYDLHYLENEGNAKENRWVLISFLKTGRLVVERIRAWRRFQVCGALLAKDLISSFPFVANGLE
jgi:hypothetical protein